MAIIKLISFLISDVNSSFNDKELFSFQIPGPLLNLLITSFTLTAQLRDRLLRGFSKGEYWFVVKRLTGRFIVATHSRNMRLANSVYHARFL